MVVKELNYCVSSVNTGVGWQLTADWHLPDYFYFAYLENDYHSRSVRTVMFDVNGDGLADIMQYENNYMDYFITGVYLNNGREWKLSNQYSLSNVNFTDYYFSNTKYVDINNDGLVDILLSERFYSSNTPGAPYIDTKKVYLNNGQTGWYLDSNWEIPLIFKTNYIDNGDSYYGLYDLQARPADINGDGAIDLIQSIEIEHQGEEKHAFLGNPTR